MSYLRPTFDSHRRFVVLSGKASGIIVLPNSTKSQAKMSCNDKTITASIIQENWCKNNFFFFCFILICTTDQSWHCNTIFSKGSKGSNSFSYQWKI